MKNIIFYLFLCFSSSLPDIFSGRGVVLTHADESFYDFYSQFSEAKCVFTGSLDGIFCLNFNSWPHLIDLINTTNASTPYPAADQSFNLKPKEPLVITGKLDLWIVSSIVCNQLPSCPGLFSIQISEVTGVDILNWKQRRNLFNATEADRIQFELTINSPIQFYMGELGPGEFNCSNQQQFLNDFNTNLTNGTFFNYFATVRLTAGAIDH
jgi:hypothetical protein